MQEILDEEHVRTGYIAGMRAVGTILLALAAIACLAAAYRFASHGITLHDNFCIGLGSAATVVAALLLWAAFRTARRKRT